jgi:hypothetical protein
MIGQFTGYHSRHYTWRGVIEEQIQIEKKNDVIDSIKHSARKKHRKSYGN